MSTTEKGTNFEVKVHGIINELLQNRKFILSAPFYSLFHQKGYYSADRLKDIIVDLSIEFRREETSNPFLYLFIECKDYNSPVPVNDIEELYSKTEQISGINVKAMLFTRSSLQEGAFNYARSKGIGVVRLMDDDSLAWLIERTNKHLVTSQPNSVVINVMNAIVNENFVTTKRDTFGSVGNQVFYSVEETLAALLADQT